MNPYTDCIATSKKMVLLAQCLNVVFLVTYFAIFFEFFLINTKPVEVLGFYRSPKPQERLLTKTEVASSSGWPGMRKMDL